LLATLGRLARCDGNIDILSAHDLRAKGLAMGIAYYPKAAEIYMCEFPRRDAQHMDEDVQHGEMVKARLVVVVNKKLAGRDGLVNVVPISMTPPQIPCPWHVLIPNSCLPALVAKSSSEPRYAKCDMVCTVSLTRLHYYQGHWNSDAQIRAAGVHRKRVTQKGKLDMATFRAVKLALAAVLGVTANVFREHVAVLETLHPESESSETA
jgi:uncharacterized protein YifN (PemK superfamily)